MLSPAALAGLLGTPWQPDSEAPSLSPILGRQAGLGLLLASALNALALWLPSRRQWVHGALLAFLTAFVASHWELFRHHDNPWLVALFFLPVALYALPLLPWRAPLFMVRGEEGEVKWFNPNKGFGFILTADGREVFVHFRAVRNGGRRALQQGMQVRFRSHTTERGEQAERVYILS
ncbi:cold-shock protein [Isoalcanivorax beigongshangi]|uniref:Cold-shock protein n=1 Tax=Isoalcanivorax beigongshangi TaxID=3238810 RepID=A0ABV4AF55_9GAMM